MIRAMRLEPLVLRPRPAMNQFLDLTALFAVAAALLLGAASCAQSDDKKAPPDPAVTALLDKMAKQRGPTSPTKNTSITIAGDYAVTFGKEPAPVASGPFTELFAGADLARHTSAMGDMGAMEKGVFRDVVWEIDPSMGAKVLRGGTAAQQRRYFALLRGEDPRALNHEIVSDGKKTIDGREATVLRLTPAEGPPSVWYVDADGTLLRVETALHAPESADAAFGMNDAMTATITFADWKDVDVGRFPMKRTLKMGESSV
jgi:hypothetical protein